MNFIEAIQRYQSEGDREILNRIRHAMNTDFLAYKTRGGTAAFETMEMRIAFRCMRLIGGRLATIKFTLSEYGMDPKRDLPESIFVEFAGQIRAWTKIDLTVDNFTEYESYLYRYLGDSFIELHRAYLRLTGQMPTVWSLLSEQVVNAHWDDLAEALEYAITRVDTERSEGEIVRFINMATRTAYFRKQAEGLRRVRRDGGSKYVEPKFYGEIYAIFGKQNVDTSKFTARQRVLIDRITAVITKDMADGREDKYAVDMRGGYRLVNRYIAGRLDMHEGSLSRALTRIKSVKH